MACFTRLKEDIKFLETTFTRKNERFQVLSASVDEIACRFIGKNGERYVIHANITVSASSQPETKSISFEFHFPMVCCGSRGLGVSTQPNVSNKESAHLLLLTSRHPVLEIWIIHWKAASQGASHPDGENREKFGVMKSVSEIDVGCLTCLEPERCFWAKYSLNMRQDSTQNLGQILIWF